MHDMHTFSNEHNNFVEELHKQVTETKVAPKPDSSIDPQLVDPEVQPSSSPSPSAITEPSPIPKPTTTPFDVQPETPVVQEAPFIPKPTSTPDAPVGLTGPVDQQWLPDQVSEADQEAFNRIREELEHSFEKAGSEENLNAAIDKFANDHAAEKAVWDLVIAGAKVLPILPAAIVGNKIYKNYRERKQVEAAITPEQSLQNLQDAFAGNDLNLTIDKDVDLKLVKSNYNRLLRLLNHDYKTPGGLKNLTGKELWLTNLLSQPDLESVNLNVVRLPISVKPKQLDEFIATLSEQDKIAAQEKADNLIQEFELKLGNLEGEFKFDTKIAENPETGIGYKQALDNFGKFENVLRALPADEIEGKEFVFTNGFSELDKSTGEIYIDIVKLEQPEMLAKLQEMLGLTEEEKPAAKTPPVFVNLKPIKAKPEIVENGVKKEELVKQELIKFAEKYNINFKFNSAAIKYLEDHPEQIENIKDGINRIESEMGGLLDGANINLSDKWGTSRDEYEIDVLRSVGSEDYYNFFNSPENFLADLAQGWPEKKEQETSEVRQLTQQIAEIYKAEITIANDKVEKFLQKNEKKLENFVDGLELLKSFDPSTPDALKGFKFELSDKWGLSGDVFIINIKQGSPKQIAEFIKSPDLLLKKNGKLKAAVQPQGVANAEISSDPIISEPEIEGDSGPIDTEEEPENKVEKSPAYPDGIQTKEQKAAWELLHNPTQENPFRRHETLETISTIVQLEKWINEQKDFSKIKEIDPVVKVFKELNLLYDFYNNSQKDRDRVSRLRDEIRALNRTGMKAAEELANKELGRSATQDPIPKIRASRSGANKNAKVKNKK
jgi:hypothetical protein